jgi:hypothetical protein
MARTIDIAKDFGPFLLGRAIGKRIRERCFGASPKSWPALDFSGIEQATESCLDEILGTLARQHGRDLVNNIEIRGARESVRETLAYVKDLIKNPPPLPTADSVRRLLRPRKRAASG